MEHVSPILIFAVIGLFSLVLGILRNRQSSRPAANPPAPPSESSKDTPGEPDASAESSTDTPGEPDASAEVTTNNVLLPDMALRILGSGERTNSRLCSRSTLRLQWVSRETDTQNEPVRTRTPEEHTRTCLQPLPFTAAGKSYASVKGLTTKRQDDGTYLDCHGRRVISLAERFPCFDSYDYATENRYYRWYIILEPERLTRVYTEDDSPQIYITEDVRDLENRCVDALRTLGLIF